MDTKSLAKSKRAHTLHNKNKNPHSNHHQKSKFQAGTTNTAGDGSKKTKPITKQDKERARQSKLPSNWDRYDDNYDGENELEALPSDVVLPKSKGADFRYLVSEAQANSTQSLSLDDIFAGDFEYGLGSMLAVRGEGILSWVDNDNFMVDDQTTARNEASFLSLNLQALAEQLAKVDASERLFIEAELLPPEMTDQASKTNSNVESDEIRLTTSEASTDKFEEFAIDDISDKNKLLNENGEDILSVMPVGAHSESVLSEEGLNTWNQAEDGLIHNQDGKSSQIHPLNHSSQINTHSVAESRRETSTFKAAGAEAELDMLLDSFNESKLLDSPARQSGISHISERVASPAQQQHARNAPLSSKTTSIATNIDDALDDLLEETSNLVNHNDSYKPAAAGVKGADINFPPSSSQSVDKSKVLDDFDSWFDTL